MKYNLITFVLFYLCAVSGMAIGWLLRGLFEHTWDKEERRLNARDNSRNTER